MVDLDKAVYDFKNMFNFQGSMNIISLLEEAYKGKLMILQLLECNNGSLFSGEIAKKLNVSTARVATAIKSLQEKGYVLRNQSNDDARKVLVTITSLGKKILLEYNHQVDSVLKNRLQKLNEEELKTFIDIGAKLFEQ